SLLVAVAIVIFGATVLSLLEPLLPLHLQRRLQGNPTSIGLIFAAAVVAYGVCSPLAGWLADRIGRRPVMFGAMLASSVALPLIALPQTWWGEGVALALLGTTCAFLLTPALPELADQLDRGGSQAYGVAYAIFNTAYAIGMLAGPLAGGAAAEAWGFLATLAILGTLALASLPGLCWLARVGDR
ncbi:MAG TPA: MFS transporter, partial [Planctomycetaceae bacterium]|nr:MFS transporter [Planctomycetaceae bacterium]